MYRNTIRESRLKPIDESRNHFPTSRSRHACGGGIKVHTSSKYQVAYCPEPLDMFVIGKDRVALTNEGSCDACYNGKSSV